MLHIKGIIICYIYSIIILPQAVARCLCSRQCSVICSKTARHEQGRLPRGHPQQTGWRCIQRHDPKSIGGEWHFSCSWISLFQAGVVSRAWKKDCNSLQKCSIPEAGELGGRVRGSAVGGEQLEMLLSLLSTESNPSLLSRTTCIFLGNSTACFSFPSWAYWSTI